jgi:hypothetical protein
MILLNHSDFHGDRASSSGSRGFPLLQISKSHKHTHSIMLSVHSSSDYFVENYLTLLTMRMAFRRNLFSLEILRVSQRLISSANCRLYRATSAYEEKAFACNLTFSLKSRQLSMLLQGSILKYKTTERGLFVKWRVQWKHVLLVQNDKGKDWGTEKSGRQTRKVEGGGISIVGVQCLTGDKLIALQLIANVYIYYFE